MKFETGEVVMVCDAADQLKLAESHRINEIHSSEYGKIYRIH